MLSNVNAMSRREFCKRVLAMSASICVMQALSGCTVNVLPRFASAYTDNHGDHYVGWFNGQGEILGKVAIDSRAHDLCYVPDNDSLLVFSRRPGRVMYVIDVNENKIRHRIDSAENQHFFGHGTLSLDGRFLYTTENKFDPSYHAYEGLIVVRNTHNYKVEAQFNSGGIGPHQLAMLRQQNTLVVANGGIHTHPARPRTKLNIDSMKPNLSYIDISSGKVVETVLPPDNQLSTRHLCLAKNDTVYVGCQYQGPAHYVKPLVFSHSRGEQLHALPASDEQWRSFKQYIASLAVSHDDHKLAVTSPRGGVVGVWDRHLQNLPVIENKIDCAGIAPYQDEFIASTGSGILSSYKHQVKHELHWDNHMIYM
ncbi:hypothetical protein PA25_34260 [Pseudoalteromonas sp. A25]|uniref:DUF1513 domain-containing protein n=1 Tax=Pseudoalteromonas sp. A25 TaxID=116092 RepID=UPI00126062A3|nr:DUF1513 domain-containing protein [Pseudoalteromonas sp. A25]BBN83441.1 hypothetical protein PA25_34260 [Pseudoalteromonas sp. A25]